MSYHTPGKWQMHDSDHCPEEIWGNLEGPLEDGQIHGKLVCVVEDGPVGFGDEERANARLIAAAPELLEAVIHMMAAITTHANHERFGAHCQVYQLPRLTAAWLKAKGAVTP